MTMGGDVPETDEEETGFPNPADIRAEDPDALNEYVETHQQANEAPADDSEWHNQAE